MSGARVYLLRYTRLLLWACGSAVITAVIIAGALVGVIRDEQGRVWLIQGGLALANDQLAGYRLEADGIASTALGDWHFERLRLRYRGHDVMVLHQVVLHFDWRALAERRLTIEQLQIDDISYYPPTAPSPLPAISGSGDWRLMDIRPWQIAVASVAVRHFQIHPEQRDQPAVPAISLSGGFALWQNNLPLQGKLQGGSLPTPGFEGLPDFSFAIGSQATVTDRMQLQVELLEPAGGWLGQQLMLPTGQPLSANARLELQSADRGFDLQLSALTFPWQEHLLKACGQLQINPQFTVFTLSDGRVDIDGHSQSLQGSWQALPGSLALALSLQQLPLTIAQPWLPSLTAGTATGRVDISGLIGELTTQFDLQSSATIERDGERWQASGTLKGDYRSQRFDITAAQLRLDWQQQTTSASSDIDALGTVNLAAGQLALTGRIKRLDSGLINALLQRAGIPLPERLRPLEASLQASHFDFAADSNAPWLLQRFDLQATLQGHYAGKPLQVSLDATGSPQLFTLRDSTIDFAGSSLDLNGTVDLAASANDFSARVVRLDPQLLRDLSLPVAVPANIDGVVSATMSVRGVLSKPATQFDATADLQYLPAKLPVRVSLKGNSQARHIAIEALEISLPDQTANPPSLQISGELDTTTTLPAMNWQLQTRNFPLAVVTSGQWPDPESVVSSRLNVSWPGAEVADSNGLALAQISGDFDYRSGALRFQTSDRTEIESQLRWKGTLEDANQQRALVLESTVALSGIDAAPGKLALFIDKASMLNYFNEREHLPTARLQAQLDLRALAFLLPAGTDLGGILDTDVSVDGAVAVPQVKGRLTLSEARISNEDLGITLQPIGISAIASGQSLDITEFHAADGRGGRLQGQGAVNWADPTAEDAINLSVTAEHLGLIEREEIQGEVSGALQLTGTLQHWLLAGDLRVEPLNVSIDGGGPGEDIPGIDVRYRDEDTPADSGAWPRLEFDISLRAVNRAFLRGRGLDAELAGAMRLQGDLDKLKIKGAFDLVRGHFDLLGNRFTLTDGNARFSNESLAVLATGEMTKGGRAITATLAGTDQQLQFTLKSNPAMPEDEIIAWMMFGKSMQEISATQALQLASAISTLRGGGFDPIGKTRDLLGADSLTLDTQDTSNGTALSIGAGKYLTERVYLELERTADPTDPWHSAITIELTSQLSLRSTMSTSSTKDGVELHWHLDY